MAKEEWRNRAHKKIALERLDDAIALFEKKRYLASLYIVGYVFEMVVQYELKRLGDIPLVTVKKEKTEAIVDKLASNAIYYYVNQPDPPKYMIISNLWKQAKELREKILSINGFSVYDFLVREIEDTPCLLTNNKTVQQKQLRPLIKDRPLFWAIINGRLGSNIHGVSGHHDTVKLVEILAEWSSMLGAPGEEYTRYSQEFKSLEWKVELRYEYTQNNEPKKFCQTAKTAIELARHFFKTVVTEVAELPNIKEPKCSSKTVKTEAAYLSNTEKFKR